MTEASYLNGEGSPCLNAAGRIFYPSLSYDREVNVSKPQCSWFGLLAAFMTERFPGTDFAFTNLAVSGTGSREMSAVVSRQTTFS